MSNPTSEAPGNGSFIMMGILLVLAGAAAVAFPFVTTVSVEIFIGSFVLVTGLVTVVHAFTGKGWSGFFWQLAIGILYVLAGIAFLAAPIAGVVTLTIMLGGLFVAEGIARMVMAFRIRPAQAWGWVLASGGISLLLGILLTAGVVRGGSLDFIGLLVGFNLFFAGVSFITIGAGGRQFPVADPA